MTKKLTILLLILVLALVACDSGGGSDDNDEGDAISSESTPTQEAPPEEVTEEVTVESQSADETPEADVTEEVELDVTDEAVVDATEEVEMDVTDEADVDATEEVEMDVTDEADVDATEEVEMDVTEEADVDATEEVELDVTDEADVDATEEADAEVTPDFSSDELVLIDGFTLLDQDCPLQFDFQYPEDWEVATAQVNSYIFNVTPGDDSATLNFNVRGSIDSAQVANTLSRASGEVIGQIESNGEVWDVVAQDRDNGRRYQFVVYNSGIFYYNVRLDVTGDAVDDSTVLMVIDAMLGNECQT